MCIVDQIRLNIDYTAPISETDGNKNAYPNGESVMELGMAMAKASMVRDSEGLSAALRPLSTVQSMHIHQSSVKFFLFPCKHHVYIASFWIICTN
jgi:hypothetical protein